jgi:ring-1,2-phenylacetyl-CoA epoxidase subunit PaaC
MTATARPMCPEHVPYLLRIADGSLILAQRLGEWCGHAPVIEEDIALTNIALDLLGQARLLYGHAGIIEGRGRDEDTFAYWRDEPEFFNPTLVELPNGDFAQTVVRAYLYVTYQSVLWPVLARSMDADLAAIAAKSRKETQYHREHLGSWVLRLGDGTAESHGRMQRALDYLHPYTRELFETDAVERGAAAAGVGVEPLSLATEWRAVIEPTIAQATLRLPPATPFVSTGKVGRHAEAMGHLLAEMQSLARAHPGAHW